MPSAPHGEGVQQAEPDAPVQGSVGALLRASRLRLGIDLGLIAETLRIRRVYLEAIEDGRYGDLPGGTYAVGFIRSYAEQLGLDPVELVRRFKAETVGTAAPQPQPVEFPQPVKTLGLPIGAILTVIVVVAALAGGAWYLFSGAESASLLPRIPAALNEKVGAAPAPVAAVPAAPEAEKPAAEPEKPAAAEKPAAPQAEPPKPEAAKPAPKAEPPKAEPPKPEPPKPEAAKPAPKPEAAKPAPKPEPPKAEAPRPEPPKPAAAAPAPQPAPAAAAEPAAAEPAGNAPETAESAPREPRVYGAENADARIEIVATGESWVQVTEGGNLVLTRLLHAGDRFMVPNRPGLLLMTGNAGNLDVVVDGAKAPALGSAGQVLRDVALEPERLRGGR
ncbi:MAG: helix-turn-helix domain-containing protein [Rhodospirillaceae bacterium]